MRLNTLIAAAASLSLVSLPAVAAPANRAAPLSIAKSVRAAAPTTRTGKLAGGGIVVALLAAVLVGTIVIAITTDDDGSDSN